MRVDNENEATKKTREDRAQYEYNNQKKTIAHSLSSEETMARESVASIHEYVGGFDDVLIRLRINIVTHKLLLQGILTSTQQRLKQ